jgi:hypothetical protein
MKLCPKGHVNFDTAIISSNFGCIHFFLVDEPKPVVAPVKRSYPTGTNPEFDTGSNFWTN